MNVQHTVVRHLGDPKDLQGASFSSVSSPPTPSSFFLPGSHHSHSLSHSISRPPLGVKDMPLKGNQLANGRLSSRKTRPIPVLLAMRWCHLRYNQEVMSSYHQQCRSGLVFGQKTYGKKITSTIAFAKISELPCISGEVMTSLLVYGGSDISASLASV